MVNGNSGKVLDDPAYSTADSTIIQQYQLNGGINQQWKLAQQSDGYDTIANAYSGKVLNVIVSSTRAGTLIVQYTANGAANQEWALTTPNTSAASNPNWSGYVAADKISSPTAGTVTYVAGTWTVPAVTGPSTGTYKSAVWVGIDGFGTHSVEQVGTEEDVVNGVASYSAWWEMYSSITKQAQQPIDTITVKAGDVITASVKYVPDLLSTSGSFELYLDDTTRSDPAFDQTKSSADYQNPLATRSMAEWIVETPTYTPTGSTSSYYAALPNFGGATFSNASAKINGTLGPINSSKWQSQALNINSGGTTYDTTTNLTPSGDGFGVIFNNSGVARLAPAGSGGTNTTRGETVGTTHVERPLTISPVVAGLGASSRSPVAKPIVERGRPALGILIDPKALDSLFADRDMFEGHSLRLKGFDGLAHVTRHPHLNA
jgi:hypothetical protein